MGWKLPRLPPLSIGERILLALGTGFGSGFLRPAPGTWGSIVGFGYAWLLLRLPNLGWVIVVTVAGVLLSVPVCGQCARWLRSPDPGAVVLDEIACAPVALIPTFGHSLAWWHWVVAFVLYRVLDILKPFPARQMEKLPGGWGIMFDDVVSSLYMAGLCYLCQERFRLY
jgi:phosphatidylglycerophosphatase A